jgi:hypothetical protein
MVLGRRALAALAPILLTAGCAAAEPPARCAYEGARDAAPSAGYRYRVSAGPAAEQLCVEVDLPRGAASPLHWQVEAPLGPFVRDVAMAEGGAFRPVPARDGGFVVPACGGERDCRLRYRVLLGDAASALHDRNLALWYRSAILAPPTSWLLRPALVRAPYRATIATPPSLRFVSGLLLSASDPSVYEGDVADLDEAPYAAFGPLSVTRATLPSGSLDIALGSGDLTGISRAELVAWFERCARAVAAYYERFPIAHAALLALVGDGRGLGDGRTLGGGGGSITVTVGASTAAADLADDWILVHEMVHLSFPSVRRPWAEEGLATYLEPIIRVRAGLLDPDDLWRSMIVGLPQGLPEAGDQGLDHTDTWGRRYWGGALFWFLSDLEIRRRTENRRSLDDALRAVNRAGGNVAVTWDLDRALGIGDQAAGTPVLVPLRAKLGGAPVSTDLDALWKSLGIALQGRRVIYDDAAPLAAVRRSMVKG